MQKTIDETYRRREKQIQYNKEHNITPRQIIKSREAILGQTAVADAKQRDEHVYFEKEDVSAAADPVVQYMSEEQIRKAIANLRKEIEKAVKELDFIQAAKLRDEMFAYEDELRAKG
jgi:excinuclease ABC subunit B